MEQFTETAVKVAREAGEYLMQHFGGFIGSTDKESHHSIVTEYDLEAERIVLGTIQKYFPTHSILSEEKGYKKRPSEYTWVIDPLDGSSYFARGIPTFSVSIGLLRGGEIISGVIFCPAQNEMFYASTATGAFLNGNRIQVSSVKNLSEAICSVGHRYLRLEDYDSGMRKLLKSTRSIRGGGSCAQELCYLSCGRIDVLLTVNQCLWDYAAGALILKEAGGEITDVKANEIDLQLHLTGKFDLLATNRFLHRSVLTLV